jgi:serine/threonine protein kinase
LTSSLLVVCLISPPCYFFLEDEIEKKTIIREVKILKMLNHVNVVNLIEAFKRRGKLYLVFEFCDKNMLEILEENPNGIDPELVRFYIWQLCRSLEYCHRSGIIHRGLFLVSFLSECPFDASRFFIQISSQRTFLCVQMGSSNFVTSGSHVLSARVGTIRSMLRPVGTAPRSSS